MRLRSPATLTLVLMTALAMGGCGDREARDLAKAKVLAAKKDIGGARIELKNAVQAHPKSGEARFLMGQQLLADGEPALALIELQRARDYQYNESLVVPLIAETMLINGQSPQVIEKFSATQLPDPVSMARLQAALAYALTVQGDTARARAAVERGLALAPKSAQALAMKVRLAAIDNDPAAAMAVAEELLAAHPGDPVAWGLKADLLQRTPNGRAAAIAAYNKALQFKPEMVYAHSTLIGMYMTDGNLDAARKQLALLKKVAPQHLDTAMFDAHLAAASGDLSRAREIFQTLLRVLPTNINVLLAAGETELKLNAPIQAEALFAKASALAPDNALARRLLAQVQIKLGQAPKALVTLAPLVDAASPRPDELALAALARLMNGDAKGADALYTRLSKLKPTDPQLRTVVAVTGFGKFDEDAVFQQLRTISNEDTGTSADMAIVSAYLRRGRYDEALKALTELNRKRPNEAHVHQMRGQVLVMKDDHAGARQSFAQALAIDENYFPTVASLASLDLQDQQPEVARKRFTDLLKRQPKNGQAMLALAELSIRAGEPRSAVIQRLEAAVKAAPTNADVRIALVQQHLATNNLDAALGAALAGTVAIPDNIDLLEMVGHCQLRMRQYSQALVTYGNIASQAPRSPRGYVGMAEVHLVNNDLDAAQRAIDRSFALTPDLPEAHVQAVAVALRRKQPDKALLIARSLQTARPEDATGLLLEGEVEFGRGNWNSAVAAYRKALDKPIPGIAASRLHASLMQAGKTQEAESFAAKWLKSNPRDVAFLYFLADDSQTRGDRAGAIRRYQEVLALQPTHALALNNLAMLLIEAKEPGGLAMAKRAVQAAPNRAELLDTLAQAQASENLLKEAIETQQRAVVLEPDRHEIRLRLAQLLLQAGEKAKAKSELDRLAALGTAFDQHAEVTVLRSKLTTLTSRR